MDIYDCRPGYFIWDCDILGIGADLLSVIESRGDCMTMVRGSQSICFQEAPYVISAGSIVGKKEFEGPLGNLFDMAGEDNLFGEQTWEAAESRMQKEACVLALEKAGIDAKEVRYLYGGDLLRQGIATSMGVEALQIPMFGLYGSRIWRTDACCDIQSFWKCRERIPISAGICQSEAAVCPLDCNRERRLFNRKETESCESVRSNRWKDC